MFCIYQNLWLCDIKLFIFFLNRLHTDYWFLQESIECLEILKYGLFRSKISYLHQTIQNYDTHVKNIPLR